MGTPAAMPATSIAAKTASTMESVMADLPESISFLSAKSRIGPLKQ